MEIFRKKSKKYENMASYEKGFRECAIHQQSWDQKGHNIFHSMQECNTENNSSQPNSRPGRDFLK
jgi:hypothetical protein